MFYFGSFKRAVGVFLKQVLVRTGIFDEERLFQCKILHWVRLFQICILFMIYILIVTGLIYHCFSFLRFNKFLRIRIIKLRRNVEENGVYAKELLKRCISFKRRNAEEINKIQRKNVDENRHLEILDPNRIYSENLDLEKIRKFLEGYCGRTENGNPIAVTENAALRSENFNLEKEPISSFRYISLSSKRLCSPNETVSNKLKEEFETDEQAEGARGVTDYLKLFTKEKALSLHQEIPCAPPLRVGQLVETTAFINLDEVAPFNGDSNKTNLQTNEFLKGTNDNKNKDEELSIDRPSAFSPISVIAETIKKSENRGPAFHYITESQGVPEKNPTILNLSPELSKSYADSSQPTLSSGVKFRYTQTEVLPNLNDGKNIPFKKTTRNKSLQETSTQTKNHLTSSWRTAQKNLAKIQPYRFGKLRNEDEQNPIRSKIPSKVSDFPDPTHDRGDREKSRDPEGSGLDGNLSPLLPLWYIRNRKGKKTKIGENDQKVEEKLQASSLSSYPEVPKFSLKGSQDSKSPIRRHMIKGPSTDIKAEKERRNDKTSPEILSKQPHKLNSVIEKGDENNVKGKASKSVNTQGWQNTGENLNSPSANLSLSQQKTERLPETTENIKRTRKNNVFKFDLQKRNKGESQASSTGSNGIANHQRFLGAGPGLKEPGNYGEEEPNMPLFYKHRLLYTLKEETEEELLNESIETPSEN